MSSSCSVLVPTLPRYPAPLWQIPVLLCWWFIVRVPSFSSSESHHCRSSRHTLPQPRKTNQPPLGPIIRGRNLFLVGVGDQSRYWPFHCMRNTSKTLHRLLHAPCASNPQSPFNGYWIHLPILKGLNYLDTIYTMILTYATISSLQWGKYWVPSSRYWLTCWTCVDLVPPRTKSEYIRCLPSNDFDDLIAWWNEYSLTATLWTVAGDVSFCGDIVVYMVWISYVGRNQCFLIYCLFILP